MTGMKVIIGIDEEIYRHAKNGSEDSNDEWNAMRAIANGTPIPDNATNGDVIKAMFPNALRSDYTENDMVILYLQDENESEMVVFEDWYSAPYQKGGKDERYNKRQHIYDSSNADSVFSGDRSGSSFDGCN